MDIKLLDKQKNFIILQSYIIDILWRKTVDDVFEKVTNRLTLSQLIEKKIEDAIPQKKLHAHQKLPTGSAISFESCRIE